MTVYYWKGAEGASSLLEEYQDAIQCLLTGDYRAADLEKLQNNSNQIIYSYRLNIEDRLLFTTREGRLHVLEYS